jgi:hypothetical protein
MFLWGIVPFQWVTCVPGISESWMPFLMNPCGSEPTDLFYLLRVIVRGLTDMTAKTLAEPISGLGLSNCREARWGFSGRMHSKSNVQAQKEDADRSNVEMKLNGTSME